MGFALGSVMLSLMLGLGLAILLSWEGIQGRSLYRTLLIVPYALPAFISILVFRGFFNPGFGEINLILEKLFQIKPDWFLDPGLARGMVLWVNIWLSYPFMMILCLGYLQTIPSDLYEAAVLDGASPWDCLWQITLPWILPPLIPLLVTSFAFAFNNVVLILLLTEGGPNQVNAATSVGETDILASYTYRLAFGQAEAEYGLAAAIATIIFGIMLGLTGIQNRLTSASLKRFKG
jgi:maltose/maltodextrin transport system permease protein